MRRATKSALLALSVVLFAALPAPASALNGTILPGVSAGAVDLSGLTVTAAAAKLDQTLGPQLSGPLIVGAAGRVFRLSARGAGEKLDALRTAKRADNAVQAGPVALALTHSRNAVRNFVIGIGRTVDQPSRDAMVSITLTRIYRVRDREGHLLGEASLESRINQALDTPGAVRIFHERIHRTRARVRLAQLGDVYATILTIDRSNFRLRLFKHLRFDRSYPIAVGMVGLATPAGLYHVLEKQVNPAWHVPNAPWAGSLAGQTIPPGPGDPLVARWLGLGNGVGIHGTNEPWSIGSRASHGCIRMLPSDVIQLYPLVPLNTPVYIQ